METDEAVGVPLRAPGIPLFSARLLAMEDWGNRRREGARVVAAEGEEVLADWVRGGGDPVVSAL